MAGISVRQMPDARGQRGWKGQPGGGAKGLGTSPAGSRRAVPTVGIGARDGIKQHARIGMTGVAKERSRGSRLDDAAEIHDGDMIADVPHDPQVVRDEEIGKTAFRLNVLQQVDDLRLDRDVERGDRLVGDDQRRVESEGTGDGKALALPAGELRRAIAKLIGAASPTRRNSSATRSSMRGRRERAVDAQRLRDGIARPACAG